MSEAAGAGAGRAEEAAGRYSPPLLSALQVERAEAVEAAEDVRQLEARRARVKARMMDTRAAAEAAAAEDPLVAAEGRKGMEQGEARFSFEVPLEKKVAWWHDKYRPRKPKYFNRVHTGYEWNKYNQTHYDHDNPPPKMVQGYKFNIFYPDLIDRQRAPAYQLLPDPSGAKDTCVIRFRGGPPYEDLAFKIVNREWEHSHKRGFKCRFERDLQLYFKRVHIAGVGWDEREMNELALLRFEKLSRRLDRGTARVKVDGSGNPRMVQNRRTVTRIRWSDARTLSRLAARGAHIALAPRGRRMAHGVS